MVYPALLTLMRTPRLPVVDWTDTSRQFKWTRRFRRKTKSGFWACAITFQLFSTYIVVAGSVASNALCNPPPSPLWWLLVPCFSHPESNNICNPEIVWFSVTMFESSQECTSDTAHIFYMRTYFVSNVTNNTNITTKYVWHNIVIG